MMLRFRKNNVVECFRLLKKTWPVRNGIWVPGEGYFVKMLKMAQLNSLPSWVRLGYLERTGGIEKVSSRLMELLLEP